jgi:general secretion pathway protein M
MKDWLATRTPRERQILVIGGVFLILALLYGTLVHPFYAGLARLRQTAAEQHSLLHWMRGTAREIQSLRGSAAVTPASGGSILSVVNQAARREHLEGAVRRLEPDNTGGVRVWLKQAPFDQVVRWLGALQRNTGLRIESLSLEATGVPGQVNGRVVLKGTAS